jgi:hypothetical protein
VRPRALAVLRFITSSNFVGCTALLLIGHGGFEVFMQKDWSGYAATIGISPAILAAHPLRLVGGWFEVALGLLVLAWPARGLLLFVFVWKLSTEALRPFAGEPIWEFIERGGSYGAPFALACLTGKLNAVRLHPRPAEAAS